MSRRGLVERLQAGEVLLVDGAMGQVIEERGAKLWDGNGFGQKIDSIQDVLEFHPYEELKGTDPQAMREAHEAFLRKLGPWSAHANIESPDLVRDLHEDYLRLGADILMTNNFWTSRSNLVKVGRADEWERYTRAGARLAIDARDAVSPDALVAAAMAPATSGDVRADFAERASAAADEGVDILMPEYLGAIEECVAAAEACAPLGLPILLAVRHVGTDGNMQYHETFPDLARALDGLPVAGILIMCSLPADVTAALPNLRDAFDGPVGAYPNDPRDLGEGADKGACLADFTREWIDMGAQMVGGCCGIGPDLLADIAHVVKAPQPA